MDFLTNPELINKNQSILRTALFQSLTLVHVKGRNEYHYNNEINNWYCNFPHKIHFLNLFGKYDRLKNVLNNMSVGINIEKCPLYSHPKTPAGFFIREDRHIVIGHNGTFRCLINKKQGNLGVPFFFNLYQGETFVSNGRKYALVADLNIKNFEQEIFRFIKIVTNIKMTGGCTNFN